MLPAFEGYLEGGNGMLNFIILYAILYLVLTKMMVCKAFELTGLGRGGQQVQKSKETYIKAVETLVELASLQVIL